MKIEVLKRQIRKLTRDREKQMEELEELLNQPEGSSIQVLPNGEIRSMDYDATGELSDDKMPYTLRHDLGDDY